MTTFFDTNVLVYAVDAGDPVRKEIAIDRFARAIKDDSVALSTQVLQEFYAALTGSATSPVPRRAARELIHAYSAWPLVSLDAVDVLAAADIEERHRVSFRDALIITAARKSGATLLLSDTLQPHRPITGLELQNPFA